MYISIHFKSWSLLQANGYQLVTLEQEYHILAVLSLSLGYMVCLQPLPHAKNEH